ncbi:MAG: MFS transporter [Pseudomonadota bacterium]
MSETNELKTGWRIIVASAVGVGCGLSAMPFYTLGAFAGPLADEFGWSRGEIQFAIAFMVFGSLLMAPVIGYLADRIGVRPIALFSLASLAATMAALSLATKEVWTFYLGWAVMSTLAAGSTPITWTRAITGWFDKQRGLALGLALMGTGVSGAIVPFFATYLIEAFGWRGAYVGLGVTIAVVSLPIVYLMFYERKDKAPADPAAAPVVEFGLSLGSALRGYRFWVMAVAFCIVSIGVGGLIPNMIPLLGDIGYTPERAAAMAGLIGVTVIVGRIVAGLLLDRYWGPAVAFAFLATPTISCLILAGGGFGPIFTALAVALIGLAAGAEFDLIAYFASRYFGMKNYGKIYAGQFVFFALGAGLSPALFGAVFDNTGSYNLILYIAAGFFAFGGGILLTLGRYPSQAELTEAPKAAAQA